MLIDKGITVGEIITFKMISGEEIIGKLVEETAFHYKLNRPLAIGAGPKGLAMMPCVFSVGPDREILINKVAIAALAPSDKEFADQYLQNTTGISLI